MISIIVPVYNAAAYIKETIDMVRRQTFADWELILVNDASTDSGEEIIRGYLKQLLEDQGEQRIRFISKDRNEGAAKARNTGLDAAEGRYIAFLDADDVWYPEKLEKEFRFMNEKDAGFVFTKYEFGDERAVPTGKTVNVPAVLSYRQALTRTVIFTSTVLIDTEKVDRSLIRMPEVESEDSATWWQILRSGVTAYGLNEPLAVYRRPARSLSSNKGKAVKRIWNLYRRVEHIPVPEAAVFMVLWAARATARRVIPEKKRGADAG